MSDSGKETPESFEYGRVEGSTRPSSWKKRAKEFANDTSFGAILYGFAGESWIKRVVWALILIAAVGGFCTVTILNILMLVKEPISTSITLTRESSLQFPAVTICSLSLFNTTTLKSAAEPHVEDDLTSMFAAVQDDSDIESCKQYANSVMYKIGKNPGWGELINLTGNDFSALLRNCMYVGKRCTSDDFKRIPTVGGLCYTFNGPLSEGKIRNASGTGVRRGLRLQLSPDEQVFSLGRDFGFRVVIHNPDEPPRPESDGIVVALNSTAYIGMRQVNSTDNTKFTSATRCFKNTATPNTGLSFNRYGYSTYSPSLCLEACFYKHVIDQYNCTERLLYMPVSSKYKQLRNCSATDICCEVDEFDKVEESCDCPPKCNMVERTFTISSSTNADGVVGINIYYESLFLERRETTDSYTPWSLISDIGGNTGLFLGLTLLSWVELMLFACGLAKDCCSSGRRRNVTLQK